MDSEQSGIVDVNAVTVSNYSEDSTDSS